MKLRQQLTHMHFLPVTYMTSVRSIVSKILLGLCCLCSFAFIAQADPRFVVVLDKAATAETLDDQIRRALPQIWDRILPVTSRAGVPFVAQPRDLLQRIQKGSEHTTVEINSAAVWQLLQEQGVPVLSTMPRFRLNVSLTNLQGKKMRNSQRLLAQQAAVIARRWGILLDPQASTVNMHFSWLDNQQVSLHIDGSALLSIVNENRRIQGDSFEFLRRWLRDNMLQLRDTLASSNASMPLTSPAALTTDDAYSAADSLEETADTEDLNMPTLPPNGQLIVIRKHIPLSKQLMFEQALSKEQRVKEVIPLSFSNDELRYIVQLKGAHEPWLNQWLNDHAMQATRLDKAWLIQ